MIEDHGKTKGQGGHQDIGREDQPKPGPVFDLPGQAAHGDHLEKLRAEEGQDGADGVIFAGTPNVGGVLVIDVQHVVASQGDETQLTLKDLIEHDEEHQKEQACGGAEDPLPGKLMVAQQNQQQGHRHQHPMVEVEPDNVPKFSQLVRFFHRFQGIEEGNQAADDADVEHIVLDILVLAEKEKGEQGDIGGADIDEPGVPEHPGFVHGIGRDIDLQKVQQQTEDQKTKQRGLLDLGLAVAQG